MAPTHVRLDDLPIRLNDLGPRSGRHDVGHGILNRHGAAIDCAVNACILSLPGLSTNHLLAEAACASAGIALQCAAVLPEPTISFRIAPTSAPFLSSWGSLALTCCRRAITSPRRNRSRLCALL